MPPIYHTKLNLSQSIQRDSWWWVTLIWYRNIDIYRDWWLTLVAVFHDDVIKWKHFPRHRPFVRRMQIPLTKLSDAELWCFLWSAPWINGWVNNREAGDVRQHRAHYDVIVMSWVVQHIGFIIRIVSIKTNLNTIMDAVAPKLSTSIGVSYCLSELLLGFYIKLEEVVFVFRYARKISRLNDNRRNLIFWSYIAELYIWMCITDLTVENIWRNFKPMPILLMILIKRVTKYNWIFLNSSFRLISLVMIWCMAWNGFVRDSRFDLTKFYAATRNRP